jgi:hypothetical protein
VPTLLVVGEDTDVTVPAVVEVLRFELGEHLTVATVPGATSSCGTRSTRRPTRSTRS